MALFSEMMDESGKKLDEIKRLQDKVSILTTALRRIRSLAEKNVSKYAQEIAAEALGKVHYCGIMAQAPQARPEVRAYLPREGW